ncbi:carboxypeptidase-like regulatory domain-containing protein [Edaphobacter paludis]|uniref:Carboxypeptidase-like regulatory domain-containing protein n=1 Tax=Edaphobacter paludis TaxID=3035702 RepID=A0AAU7CX68_9BACT
MIKIDRRVAMGLITACLVLFLCAPGAKAQVETGRFVGQITDPQGALVPNAVVKATNLGTNIVQTATTNSSGEFVITPVQAGVYNLTVTAKGFSVVSTSNVEVQVGQVVREDLALQLGAETTTIDVTVETPLLSTDTATIGTVITNQQLTSLPLNGRGFFRLAELTPGAALLPPTGNSLAIRPEVVDGNTISGIRGSAISFLLDGVDVSEQHQGGTFIQTSIDALQEFSVQQSPYSAEYNRGGAFFNATTKSGTNKFHGGIFEFIRNDKLDARNYFSATRAILKRNQFGGAIGGPLSIPHLYSGKDRTFFFLDYEAQRLRQGLVINSIVPTDAERNGDFSAPGLKPIYDPLTTTTTGTTTTRNQISCNGVLNVICPSRIPSQAVAVLAYIPHANSGASSFKAVPSQAIDWDQFTIRIDHQINSSNRLFGRWVYVNNREVDPNAAPALKTASLTSNGQDIAVGLITNIGANKVQDFRVHYLPSHVRLAAFLQGPDFNGVNGIQGFSGLLRPGTGGSFPDYSFSGYSALQGSAFDQRPKSQDRTVFEPTDTFTILKGKHSLKFGVLVRYYQWIGYDSSNYAGIFNFTGIETQNPTATPTKPAGGDAFADFLLGYPASVARAYPGNNFGGQRWYHQYFAQDDIRVNGRLTVNVGLRYEYSPWLNGYKGQLGTFDPTQSKPIIVESNTDKVDLSSQYAAPAAYQFFGKYIQTSSQAGLPYSITYTDRTQFGPRVGFAWRPLGNDTVVRGGFGIFYEPEGTGGRVNRNILPFLLSETVNQTQNVVPTRTTANFFLGSQLGSATANPSLLPTLTHLKVGSNQHYSLGVQQQLSPKTVFDIAYVGNHGVHLQSTDDFNDPTPAPGGVQARRPYQPWGTITYQSQDLGTTYQSLQTKIEHRAGNGLTGLISYTWSKFMQSNQSPAIGGNQGYERTYSPYNTPQNLAISGTYQLPVGRGRKYMGNSNRVVDAALGGWQVQTIIVLRSGTPYTPVVSSDRANTGVGGQRPNLNPAGGSRTFHQTLTNWFDKTKYVVAPQYTYGQVRANTLQSDAFRQYDASIFKDFAMPGESTLSFRAEFFNLPNTTSFNAPSSTIDASSCCTITSTSIPSRDIQFALKYNF